MTVVPRNRSTQLISSNWTIWPGEAPLRHNAFVVCLMTVT